MELSNQLRDGNYCLQNRNRTQQEIFENIGTWMLQLKCHLNVL